MKTLTEIEEGVTYIIKEVSSEIPNLQRRRLLDMGFYVGSLVRFLFKSEIGGGMAFEVLNTTVVLRKEQTDLIYKGVYLNGL